MKEIWYGIYILVALLALFIIPFAMFFYETDESDDPSTKSGRI